MEAWNVEWCWGSDVGGGHGKRCGGFDVEGVGVVGFLTFGERFFGARSSWACRGRERSRCSERGQLSSEEV